MAGLLLLTAAATALVMESQRPTAGAARVREPLPDGAFRIVWESIDAPRAWKPGLTRIVRVKFKNASDVAWPDPAAGAEPPGNFAVRLSYRWIRADSHQPLGSFDARADLPGPLAPGESITLAVRVASPAAPGNYGLEFDLVQELVARFTQKGAARVVVPISVS